MPYFISVKRAIGIGALLAPILGSSIAEAQMSPGGMGGGMGPGMGGPTQPSGEEKKEGVGEAAPKTPGLLPTTPALPPPKGRRKRWKLLELDGYYRARSDWFKNFNLGFIDDPVQGGAPFPRALGCSSTALNVPCDDTLSSLNMRLRLEPTINLDEGTSVHIQADALDNLVFGSTPYGTAIGSYTDVNKPPVAAFTSSQGAVTQGVNSDRPSITVKRAWAEVAVPLGIIKVGRMPNQWGMGMKYNAGGADPINGTYDYDADYGDSVDRVSFSALIPGTNLRAMLAVDWASTGLVSNQSVQNLAYAGHPFDLDDNDDTSSWVGVISRMDSPQEFRDAVDRGETAFNYGVYFEYRTQAWDSNLTNYTTSTPFDSTDHFVVRGFKTYSPDLWGKLGIGSVTLEAEVIAQLGSIDTLDDLGTVGSANIRKYGGVGRFTYRGLEGKLRIGLETGAASGDQWDNTPQGNTNIAFSNPLGGPGDHNLTQFMFNQDYKVDLILWRHLIGAVTNAAYIKPFLQYDLTKSIMFKVANVTSFALKPVATPGNSAMYGTEFDTDLGFSSGGLFAGISYGVLFPLGAMAHPDDTDPLAGGTFGYGNGAGTNQGDPGTAHTIQTRLVLSF